MAAPHFAVQVGVLVGIAVVMTVGVYGIVAGSSSSTTSAAHEPHGKRDGAALVARHPEGRAMADEGSRSQDGCNVPGRRRNLAHGFHVDSKWIKVGHRSGRNPGRRRMVGALTPMLANTLTRRRGRLTTWSRVRLFQGLRGSRRSALTPRRPTP